jgi:hypothetical protein
MGVMENVQVLATEKPATNMMVKPSLNRETTAQETAACVRTRAPDATTCHHASLIDTLPSINQRGLQSVGSLGLI